MPKAQNKILVDQINKRMDEIKMRDTVIGMDKVAMTQLQQNACRELYCEMIAEGLRTTASEILKYVELGPNQKIVETSDNFRIVKTGGVVKSTTQNFSHINKANIEALLPNQYERKFSLPDGDGATVHINITDEDLGIK